MINEQTRLGKPSKQTDPVRCTESLSRNNSRCSSKESMGAAAGVTAGAVHFPIPLTPFLHRNPHFRLQRSGSHDSLSSMQSDVDMEDEQGSQRSYGSMGQPLGLAHGHGHGHAADSQLSLLSPPRSRPLTPKSHERTHWLGPRKRFVGYQISGYKKYQVMITIQSVALPNNKESNCCAPHLTGFLTIKGLTVQNPEITTFFESITVTESLGFLSKDIPIDYVSYKATDQTDLEHWLNFPSFKELCMQNDPKDPSKNILQSIIDGTYMHADYLNQRFIYMRWNEKFLVPDADLEPIEGASYDGYYYIVHDQLLGTILGFYYHEHAEKFQQLELQPLLEPSIGDCSFEFA